MASKKSKLKADKSKKSENIFDKITQDLGELVNNIEESNSSEAKGDDLSKWAEKIEIRSNVDEAVMALEILCIPDAPSHFTPIWKSLIKNLKLMHNADLADVIERIPNDARNILIEKLAPLDAGVLTYLNENIRKQLIHAIDPDKLAKLLSELETDDAVEIVGSLDDRSQYEFIQSTSGKRRKALEGALSYEESSAARILRREFVAVPETWTAGQTIDFLRKKTKSQTIPEDFHCIILVNKKFNPTGVVPLARILRVGRQAKMIDRSQQNFMHLIPITAQQKDVAYLFRQYGLVEAPVIDEDGVLIGTITVDDIVEVIEETTEGDLLGLGGLTSDDFYKDIFRTTLSRLSWLSVNLLTAITASLVIALFEVSISQLVALAVLMPIVASMGGNAGTQTLTIAVRALATNELRRSNQTKTLIKELLVSFFNGCIFAVIMATGAYLWYDSVALAAVIAASIIVNLLTAAGFGVLIPIFLDRLKLDPATGSAVILTTFTDCIGFFIFLGLATLFVL